MTSAFNVFTKPCASIPDCIRAFSFLKLLAEVTAAPELTELQAFPAFIAEQGHTIVEALVGGDFTVFELSDFLLRAHILSVPLHARGDYGFLSHEYLNGLTLQSKIGDLSKRDEAMNERTRAMVLDELYEAHQEALATRILANVHPASAEMDGVA